MPESQRRRYETEYAMDLDQAAGGALAAVAIGGLNLIVNAIAELPKGAEEIAYIPAVAAALYAAVYAVNAWSWRE